MLVARYYCSLIVRLLFSDFIWCDSLFDSMLLFPTRLLTSEDECKWFWHQMIYFPGTINIVSTWLYHHGIYITMNSLLVFQLCTLTYSVHAGILEPWRGRLPCPFVVFSSHCGSRLASPCVRSQLTPPIPPMGLGPPFPLQNGAFIHRVRTHTLSPSRVQDSYCSVFMFNQ
jgi:hypothetical protein